MELILFRTGVRSLGVQKDRLQKPVLVSFEVPIRLTDRHRKIRQIVEFDRR